MRLTRAKRSKAGWLLALVYLLCVLAPGISFAFSDGSRAACHTDGTHGLDAARVHELVKGPPHPPQKGSYSASLALVGQSDGHNRKDTMMHLADERPAPANGQQKTSGAQCCGIMCSSSLNVSVIDIFKPSAQTSICATENYRSVVDNAPLRLYRPPIA